MKICGLDKDDFEQIDRAFRYVISTQLQKANEQAWKGDVELCENFMDAARDMIKTYTKFQSAERGYKIKRWTQKGGK